MIKVIIKNDHTVDNCPFHVKINDSGMKEDPVLKPGQAIDLEMVEGKKLEIVTVPNADYKAPEPEVTEPAEAADTKAAEKTTKKK